METKKCQQSNIHLAGVPEIRENWAEEIFEERIAQSFPKLTKTTTIDPKNLSEI
jgi:hypothetical protein